MRAATMMMFSFIASCGSSYRAPECDAVMEMGYPCSDVGYQAKISGVDDCAAVARRDGLTNLYDACAHAADVLRMASTPQDRDFGCAFADYWLAQAICAYDGGNYPDVVSHVSAWRAARARQ